MEEKEHSKTKLLGIFFVCFFVIALLCFIIVVFRLLSYISPVYGCSFALGVLPLALCICLKKRKSNERGAQGGDDKNQVSTILANIKIIHSSTIVYGIICLLLIPSSGLTVYCAILFTLNRIASIWYLVFFGSAFILLLSAFMLFRNSHSNQTHKDGKVKPYVIPLREAGGSCLIDSLIEKLSIQKLSDGNLYSHIEDSHNYLLLLYHYYVFDEKQYSIDHKKRVKDAMNFLGIKDKMPLYEWRKMCRINMVMLDHVEDEAFDQMTENAAYGMSHIYAELNVFVDLEFSLLYIPAYMSLYYGESNTYYHCVKKLLSLIVEGECK